MAKQSQIERWKKNQSFLQENIIVACSVVEAAVFTEDSIYVEYVLENLLGKGRSPE